MQVTVTISEEIAAEAAAHGSSPESYVEELLAERLSALRPIGETEVIRPKPLSREELNAGLDRLAQFSDKIPLLSDDQISRASMYEDHD